MKLEQYGSGNKTIVLIHGGPSISGYMSSLGNLLKSQYKIIDYAQRGSFENLCSLNEISMEGHLRDLEDVVKTSTTKETYLVGHSWGADLALLYEARYPGRCKKVILLGLGPLDREIQKIFSMNLASRMTDEQIEKTKSLSSEKSENQMRQAWLDIIGPCYNYNCQLIQGFPNLKWNFETYQKSSAELWKLVDSGSVDKLLLSIAIPVTAFHGDDDPIPLAETFEFLRAKIPHCKLIVIPKAGHNIWAEPEAQNYFLGLLKQELN